MDQTPIAFNSSLAEPMTLKAQNQYGLKNNAVVGTDDKLHFKLLFMQMESIGVSLSLSFMGIQLETLVGGLK
jgi:hypothetical protein